MTKIENSEQTMQFLHKVRLKMGISLQEIKRQTGLSISKISKWERSKYHLPDKDLSMLYEFLNDCVEGRKDFKISMQAGKHKLNDEHTMDYRTPLKIIKIQKNLNISNAEISTVAGVPEYIMELKLLYECPFWEHEYKAIMAYFKEVKLERIFKTPKPTVPFTYPQSFEI